MRRHLLRQGPVIRSLIRAGLGGGRAGQAPVPSPTLRATVAPRAGTLVDDYLRWCGSPRDRSLLPAHMFSQWGFPLLTQALQGVPYDLRRALNGGCRVEVHQPLHRGEPLLLEAQLEDIDDNGSRAVLRTRLTTRTASGGHVDAWMFAIVPLKKSTSSKKKVRKPRPQVPVDAKVIAERRMTARDAQQFAQLTGDINPVHWLPIAARAAGFPSTILHGFATKAFAWEGLVHGRFAGDRSRLGVCDVKFVKPVVLPATLRLFTTTEGFAVGSSPGGPAYVTGTVERS